MMAIQRGLGARLGGSAIWQLLHSCAYVGSSGPAGTPNAGRGESATISRMAPAIRIRTQSPARSGFAFAGLAAWSVEEAAFFPVIMASGRLAPAWIGSQG